MKKQSSHYLILVQSIILGILAIGALLSYRLTLLHYLPYIAVISVTGVGLYLGHMLSRHYHVHYERYSDYMHGSTMPVRLICPEL